MSYVLFLDDEREPPKAQHFVGEVVHARTAPEFVAAIKSRGAPMMVKFDWWLGIGPTGQDMAEWLIEYDREHDIIRQDMGYDSQSSDRDRARTIVRTLMAYMAEKFHEGDEVDAGKAMRSARSGWR